MQGRPEATEPRVWFSFTVWVRPTAGRGEEGSGGRKEEEKAGEEGGGEEEQEEALTVPLDPVQFGIQSFTKGRSVLQAPASSKDCKRRRVLWSLLSLCGRVSGRKRDSVREKNMHPGEA